jgi:hypothetical protein
VKKNSFGLLELEMADLERFWRKTPLGPLGVNNVTQVLGNSKLNIGTLLSSFQQAKRNILK